MGVYRKKVYHYYHSLFTVYTWCSYLGDVNKYKHCVIKESARTPWRQSMNTPMTILLRSVRAVQIYDYSWAAAGKT